MGGAKAQHGKISTFLWIAALVAVLDQVTKAVVTIKWDTRFFAVEDIANLLVRVGIQIGIGAGRPDSQMSVGQDWGTFELQRERIN